MNTNTPTVVNQHQGYVYTTDGENNYLDRIQRILYHSHNGDGFQAADVAVTYPCQNGHLHVEAFTVHTATIIHPN